MEIKVYHNQDLNLERYKVFNLEFIRQETLENGQRISYFKRKVTK